MKVRKSSGSIIFIAFIATGLMICAKPLLATTQKQMIEYVFVYYNSGSIIDDPVKILDQNNVSISTKLRRGQKYGADVASTKVKTLHGTWSFKLELPEAGTFGQLNYCSVSMSSSNTKLQTNCQNLHVYKRVIDHYGS